MTIVKYIGGFGIIPYKFGYCYYAKCINCGANKTKEYIDSQEINLGPLYKWKPEEIAIDIALNNLFYAISHSKDCTR